MKTKITVYRNKYNPNKYIEVHNDGYRHNTVRQCIKHGNVENLMGDKNLHRFPKRFLVVLLEDYEEITY